MAIESNLPEGTAWPNLYDEEYDKPPYRAVSGEWMVWDEDERMYLRPSEYEAGVRSISTIRPTFAGRTVLDLRTHKEA